MNRHFAVMPLLLAPLTLIRCTQSTHAPFYITDDSGDDKSNAGGPSSQAGDSSTDPAGGKSAGSGGKSASSSGASNTSGGAASSSGGAGTGGEQTSSGPLRTTNIHLLAFDDDFKVPVADLDSPGVLHAAMDDGSWQTVAYSGTPVNLPPFSGTRRWLRFVPSDLERYVPTIVEQVEGHDDGRIGVVVRGDIENIQEEILRTNGPDLPLETNLVVRVVSSTGERLAGAKVVVTGADFEGYEHYGEWYSVGEAVPDTDTKGLALATEFSTSNKFPGKSFAGKVTGTGSGTFSAIVAEGETTVFVHYSP